MNPEPKKRVLDYWRTTSNNLGNHIDFEFEEELYNSFFIEEIKELRNEVLVNLWEEGFGEYNLREIGFC